MCELCAKLEGDEEHRRRVSEIYNQINEKLKATKRNEEKRGEAVAFSTIPFPLMTFAVFEPRMPLQIPSNFYQQILVDGKRLRSDWASGWLRLVGFKEGSLFLLAQAFSKEGYLIFLHMVEFQKGEYLITENGKITISVNAKKEGIDLLIDRPSEHTYSFSFVHQPTERAMVPRNRIESSSFVKSIYHGTLPQKPLTFDWTTYVVTIPHFAPYAVIHQNYKNYGYSSAMEMQNMVTKLLKKHF